MENRRISRIVLGVFAIVAVGLLLAQTIVIECEKTLDNQADNAISCNLSNRLLGLISLNERRVLGVTGARLDRDEQAPTMWFIVSFYLHRTVRFTPQSGIHLGMSPSGKSLTRPINSFKTQGKIH